MKNLLVEQFAQHGSKLAEAMRRLLPRIAVGDKKAETELRNIAAGVRKSFRNAAAIFVRNAIKGAVARGQSRAVAQIQKYKPVVSIKFGGVNTRLVNALTKASLRDIKRAVDGSEKLVGIGVRRAKLALSVDKKLKDQLAAGVAQEEVSKQLQKRIMRSMNLQKNDRVLLTNGRQYDAEFYAETLTRTRLADAENQATVNEYKAQAVGHIYIPEHGGVSRKDICFVIQGKVWALHEGDSLGFPTLASIGRALPPEGTHPNCVHGVAPFIPEFEDVESELKKHDRDMAELADVIN